MKVIEYVVRLKDEASASLKAVTSRFEELKKAWNTRGFTGVADHLKQVATEGKNTTGILGTLASGAVRLAPIVGAISVAWAGFKKVIDTVSKALDEFVSREAAMFRMARALGSMEEGRARFNALKDSSAATAFGIDSVVAASIRLNNLTKGGLGDSSSIELLGKVAKQSNNDLETVAQGVGMVWGAIAAGDEQLGPTLKQLRSTGVITDDVRLKLIQMAKDGTDHVTMWKYFQSELEKSAKKTDGMGTSLEGLGKKTKKAGSDMLASIGEILSPIATLWNGLWLGIFKGFDWLFRSIIDGFKNLGGMIGHLSAGESFSQAIESTAKDRENEAKDRAKNREAEMRRQSADAAASGEISSGSGESKTDSAKSVRAETAGKVRQAELEQMSRKDRIATLERQASDLFFAQRDAESAPIKSAGPNASEKEKSAARDAALAKDEAVAKIEAQRADIQLEINKLLREQADEEKKKAADQKRDAEEQKKAREDAKKSRADELKQLRDRISDTERDYKLAKMKPEDRLAALAKEAQQVRSAIGEARNPSRSTAEQRQDEAEYKKRVRAMYAKADSDPELSKMGEKRDAYLSAGAAQIRRDIDEERTHTRLKTDLELRQKFQGIRGEYDRTQEEIDREKAKDAKKKKEPSGSPLQGFDAFAASGAWNLGGTRFADTRLSRQFGAMLHPSTMWGAQRAFDSHLMPSMLNDRAQGRRGGPAGPASPMGSTEKTNELLTDIQKTLDKKLGMRP